MTIDKGIFIRNIYYMLSYAFQELRQNNYEYIAAEEFEKIDDLFAEILVRGISYQVKRGLHREYIPHHESLSTLRGKLNLNDTIQHIIRQQTKLSCEYDELSTNNTFNQILKTTVIALLSYSDIEASRKASLRKLMLFFSEVDTIDIKNIKWTSLRFDRNSKTYQTLLYICYFILNSLIMTTEDGKYKMLSFSDDHMCRLYEKFILEYYRKHHPELHPRAAQIKWNICEEETSLDILPIMQTDVFLQNDDRTLIIDAKYYSKTLQTHNDKQIIHTGNLYQINSYVLNYDAKHEGKVDGMLLYAKTQEDITPDISFTHKDGNRFYVKTLDLNQDFASISAQLESFVKYFN